ncbi:SPOR domain-containing protein [Aurantiacibacter sp. D1-12]|uniref:SPOR domain-containing protein n=1 Tax=Aurantiacibacter sp. D1-12 TaxID=2993658 RepID=UPI00237C79E6|nr:SPOR domain-containing protein [Aurantiacibacter sp. D1-12]MDE1467089.1 SPOR domain-containing protein [Aurantiacibacter sp. D1-12]
MSLKKTVLVWATGFVAAAAIATPLAAQVREGVEAWSRGDYAAAVVEWQAPAAAGDPDAMFNLAQAYRLGRGVPQDMARAEELYARAAQAGHVQAADTYGLMLFQDGRREQALPYVQGAARRGDPRAQYLLGIAHFNGDLVGRDWVRAYALLSLANAEGLPQAGAAITQMDQHIPIEQRQAAAALARQLQTEAEQARAVELAAADLGTMGPQVAQSAPPPQARPTTSPRVPRPIPTVEVSPSVAAAQEAVRQARIATGTEDPGAAGASFASSSRTPTPPPSQPVTVARTPEPTPPPAARRPEPAPAPAPARTSGPWRVQLGAFGVAGNAERLWNRLSSRPELAGRERLLIPTGRVTRLQAGGFATRNEAQTACNALRRAGQDCLVTRN